MKNGSCIALDTKPNFSRPRTAPLSLISGKLTRKIAQLKPFHADMGALYVPALSAGIPALPVVLAQIAPKIVVMDLLKTLR
jgi:hypothetical protein